MVNDPERVYGLNRQVETLANSRTHPTSQSEIADTHPSTYQPPTPPELSPGLRPGGLSNIQVAIWVWARGERRGERGLGGVMNEGDACSNTLWFQLGLIPGRPRSVQRPGPSPGARTKPRTKPQGTDRAGAPTKHRGPTKRQDTDQALGPGQDPVHRPRPGAQTRHRGPTRTGARTRPRGLDQPPRPPTLPSNPPHSEAPSARAQGPDRQPRGPGAKTRTRNRRTNPRGPRTPDRAPGPKAGTAKPIAKLQQNHKAPSRTRKL